MPKIIQLTPWTVRISWQIFSNVENCTEYFFVRFWKFSEPNNIKFTKRMTKQDGYYVDVKVDPEILYNFQKVTAYHVMDRRFTYGSKTKRKRKGNFLITKSGTVAYRTLMTQPRGNFLA